MTELFRNHHKIQVLELVETLAVRYICAPFGCLHQTSEFIYLTGKAQTQDLNAHPPKSDLITFGSASSVAQNYI